MSAVRLGATSALVIEREALHGPWFKDDATALRDPRRHAHLALGRPQLAARVDQGASWPLADRRDPRFPARHDGNLGQGALRQ